MSKTVAKEADIKVSVGLDENSVPVSMKWTADDGNQKEQDAKAMLLALWDEQEQNTMRIDLWTKDMTVDEMKKFFHQTLLTMADTFERATGEDKICGDMRDFCFYFAERMELVPPQE